MSSLLNSDNFDSSPTGVGSEDKESKNDIKSIKEKQKYPFVRTVNQLMNIYYYTMSNDPYPPHIIFDNSDRIQLITGDNTFSLIDLKYTQPISTIKFARAKLNQIREECPNFFQEVLCLKPLKDSNSEVILAIKKMVESYAIDQKSDFSHKNKEKQYSSPVIKRLYEVAPKANGIFIETYSNDQNIGQISISDDGREYITSLMSQFFSKYQQENTLGKHRKDILFPHNIYSHHLNKIIKNQTLSEKEISEFIAYFYSELSNDNLDGLVKYVINHTNIDDPLIAKKIIKGHRSFIANHLYGGLYVEQDYDYNKIIKLSKSWSETGEDPSDITDPHYTEKHQKGLASMTDKEFRSQKVSDLVRARTWVPDKTMDQSEGRQKKLTKIFSDELHKLKSSYNKQGWIMNISKIELVNKYNKGKIDIDDKEVDNIQSSLNADFITSETIKNQTSKKSQLPSILIDQDYCKTELNASDEEIAGIIHAFQNDTLKTGGNGDYADIKIRVQYTLTHNETGETITNTGGYEHQIVHMSSTNEAGLSSHPIVLDPRKNIVNQIREKGQITVTQFQNTVNGGLQSVIDQMCNWEDILNQQGKSGLSQSHIQMIEKQFPIRNQIPSQICELANIKFGETYTNIANNFTKKDVVEKAIEKYLLRDLFKRNIIHPYFYVNNITETNQQIANEEKNQLRENNYSKEYDINSYVDMLLDSSSEQKSFYRICGGGSGNLTKTVLNATLSDKGYVGIAYVSKEEESKIIYIKVGKLANILYHSASFDNALGIIIKDFKQLLFDTISI